MREPPCKNCPDRKPAKYVDGKLVEPNCHSYCEIHKEWKEQQIAEQRKIRTAQEHENMMRGYYVETARRNQKSREHGRSRGKAQ